MISIQYWMHCEHLLVDNKKMSKSLGNIIDLREVLHRGFKTETLRYLFVSSHYRSKLNFTWESISHASNTLDRLNQFVERIRDYKSKTQDSEEVALLIRSTAEKFESEMDNDLNSPGAFAAIFDFVGKVNPAMEEGSLSSGDAKLVFELMLKFDTVSSILTLKEKAELSREIEALIRPLIGSIPYKGFIHIEETKKEEAALKKVGYDTLIGKSRTMSTLGVLPDPIITPMIDKNDPAELIYVIFHERTHQLFFKKNDVTFNENAAVLLGTLTSLEFFKKKFGPQSAEYGAQKD